MKYNHSLASHPSCVARDRSDIETLFEAVGEWFLGGSLPFTFV